MSFVRDVLALALLPALLAGCDALSSGSDGGGHTGAADTAAGDTGTVTDPGTETGDDTPPTEPGPAWWSSAHPCVGNRTDTLWLDDRDTIWVGCGSTTSGYGLYQSTDGGLTWAAPQTSPNGFFDAYRVSSISRSDDGLLYVAGINTVGSERVVSVDTSGSPMVVGQVLDNMNQTWNSMHVGTFRRNSLGFAVAESLTGTDLAYRTSDAAAWNDGYGWWGGGESYQILDMVLHDDGFYGAGSTITQPPMVFLPPQGGQAGGFTLLPVQLVTGIQEFSGEMWGIDVDDDGVVVGGVDQERDVGYVFVSGPDPYDLTSWLSFDVSILLPDEPTWIRGVCRNGQTVVAVGEFSMREDGIVLRSEDGGATWYDITPLAELGDVPSVHRCHVHDDGDLVLAGKDGFFATYDPE